MMKRKLVLFLLGALAAVTTSAWADTVTINFNLSSNGTVVPSVGTLKLSLNSDGTISGLVNVTGPSNSRGVQELGFNSPLPLAGIQVLGPNFTNQNFEVQVDRSAGWSRQFGTYNDGIGCATFNCYTQQSLIIGSPGEFTSVKQLANLDNQFGATTATEFYLSDGVSTAGGSFAPTSAVPEPGTLALLGTGVLGVAGSLRRLGSTRLG